MHCHHLHAQQRRLCLPRAHDARASHSLMENQRASAACKQASPARCGHAACVHRGAHAQSAMHKLAAEPWAQA